MEDKQVRCSDELSLDSAGEKRPKLANGKPAGASKEPAHFCIEWRQLTYQQRPARRLWFGGPVQEERGPILNSLDGRIRSGELTAILGPSGAGKTTFLSCLFGAKQEQTLGRTRVSWQDEEEAAAAAGRKRRSRSIRSAMLAQQDHLLNHLSVRESLMFASRIKNAGRRHQLAAHFHRSNVRRVARMLKLQDCLETRCGKLSGGQYKRVSIGQELLSEPEVIVLDEPTSGLDAMTCLSTIQCLKSIVSGRPMSIVLTIHQPDQEVFNLFDHVYVIAQGGLAIYEGPPAGVAPTLALAGRPMPSAGLNPARFIVEQAFLAGSSEEVCCPWEEDASSSDEDEHEHEHELTKAKASAESSKKATRQSIKRPLLMANIAIKTADGRLLTKADLSSSEEKANLERLSFIRRLNALQRARYEESASNQEEEGQEPVQGAPDEAKSDSGCSSSGCSGKPERSQSLVALNGPSPSLCGGPQAGAAGRSLQTVAQAEREPSDMVEPEVDQFVVHFREERSEASSSPDSAWPKSGDGGGGGKRQFDKRLSARRNCRRARRQDQPLLHHALLLTRRTWLSITRDPIFFGIQACMHTTIPFLLAAIFGSHQEEGCPRAGHFDLVEFAYSRGPPLGQTMMRSVRLSMGNIGVVFFEMFVLCFAINCITALVFPLDMQVLLKEHRNGWYSLRAYLLGRTLADLPVPLCLHSLALAILCHMTGQPLSPTRFLLLLLLANLASLVAQSVGLTIGALLMRSSQSAVLAAAGIVAPFFALSGFIVRIHTLPLFAQLAAQASYLHHLLNGFILLRYGFNRCPCDEQDFEPNQAHQVPQNLHTLASLWVGTYSNEFTNDNSNHSDPNIDLVEKMMEAFKMANSYGHPIRSCSELVPYAMLDFNLRDQDIYKCFLIITIMLLLSRLITFSAIYYKVRSFT